MINTNRANLISHTETTKEIPNHFIYFFLHTVHSRREIELRLVFFSIFILFIKFLNGAFFSIRKSMFALCIASHRIVRRHHPVLSIQTKISQFKHLSESNISFDRMHHTKKWPFSFAHIYVRPNDHGLCSLLHSLNMCERARA